MNADEIYPLYTGIDADERIITRGLPPSELWHISNANWISSQSGTHWTESGFV